MKKSSQKHILYICKVTTSCRFIGLVVFMAFIFQVKGNLTQKRVVMNPPAKSTSTASRRPLPSSPWSKPSVVLITIPVATNTYPTAERYIMDRRAVCLVS